MRRLVRTSLFALAVIGYCAASTAVAAEPPSEAAMISTEDAEFFERKIRPLLVQRCHECHSAESKILQGGLRLDRASGVRNGGDSGPALTPGKPDESRLIEAVMYQGGLDMPPAGKLPDAEIALLREWVARGAPFPAGSDNDAPPSAKKIDFQAARQHWAFQPLAERPLPSVKQADWPRQRIDFFLQAAMEQQGIQPSPAADRRVLIRRATFGVTGLPPTPDEVEAFVSDADANAYARLVDRLLDSPHYGERWGRFWLDLVRYCDVPEQWAQTGGQAWLYRDWVVRALNNDLPYDQFLTQQLAADQLPSTRPEDTAALGLLGLSPSYWKELKLDHNVIKTVVAEEWEERINTLTAGLLGLTVACARCHDHKFDAVTSADYYALAGVLASIRQTPRAIIPADQAAVAQQARDRVAALEASLKKLQTPQPPPDTHHQAELLKAEIAAIRAATPQYDSPLAYAVDEASLQVLPDGTDRTKLVYLPGEPQDVAIQIRGNPANPGAVVPRRFLQVLSAESSLPFGTGSGRLDLARAITHEGAPLAARVFVNRVWKQHFGRPLVDTPSNFGAQGSRPTHPELLDDLSARFVAAGWSLKWLHRELLLSSAYQQASGDRPDASQADTANKLLWRMNRQRLDVESWRDAMLCAAGTLDAAVGGPSQELGETGNRRRTLYATVRRRELHDMLRLYDFPDPTVHSPGREPTTTPLQQLFVLNSDLIARQAEALVGRVRAERPANTRQQIERAYALLFARLPSEREMSIGLSFLGVTAEAPSADDALWRQYAQALLASNEFLFVD